MTIARTGAVTAAAVCASVAMFALAGCGDSEADAATRNLQTKAAEFANATNLAAASQHISAAQAGALSLSTMGTVSNGITVTRVNDTHIQFTYSNEPAGQYPPPPQSNTATYPPEVLDKAACASLNGPTWTAAAGPCQ